MEPELERFEKNIRRYEQELGKTIDDQILAGIILNGVQNTEVRNRIIRNSYRLTTYSAMRTELLEMARTNRVLSQMPVPMEGERVPKVVNQQVASVAKTWGRMPRVVTQMMARGSKVWVPLTPTRTKNVDIALKFAYQG